MIKALIKLIEGADYDLNEWDEVSAKTPIVGDAKPPKIKALTKIIPAKKIKENLKNFANTVIPLMPPALLEFEYQRQYLVPKTLFDVLVSDEDIDDWNSLLSRFNDLLGNLTKVLNNIRKINYQKIVANKLLEQEISNRKIKVTEKLLEKERPDNKEPDSKEASDKKIKQLTALLVASGALAAATVATTYNGPPAKANFVAIAKELQTKYRLKDFQAAAIVGTWMQEGLGKGRPDDIEDAYAAQYGDFGPPPIGSRELVMVGLSGRTWHLGVD